MADEKTTYDEIPYSGRLADYWGELCAARERASAWADRLIGTVEANGLTPLELEALLVGRFKPDYLVNPRIFIQVGKGG